MVACGGPGGQVSCGRPTLSIRTLGCKRYSGEPTGEPTPSILSDSRPNSAINSTAKRHVRPHPALLGHVSKVPYEQMSTVEETWMSAQSRREVRVGGLHEPISHYTDGVICGNLVFVSGCVAVDGRGDLIGGDDS